MEPGCFKQPGFTSFAKIYFDPDSPMMNTTLDHDGACSSCDETCGIPMRVLFYRLLTYPTKNQHPKGRQKWQN
jgi:hypothetical protein